jgi:hypothetical protein
LRKIWQKTASSTYPTTRPPPPRLRSTASPCHRSRPVHSASRRSPAPPARIIAPATGGNH